MKPTSVAELWIEASKTMSYENFINTIAKNKLVYFPELVKDKNGKLGPRNVSSRKNLSRYLRTLYKGCYISMYNSLLSADLETNRVTHAKLAVADEITSVAVTWVELKDAYLFVGERFDISKYIINNMIPRDEIRELLNRTKSVDSVYK